MLIFSMQFAESELSPKKIIEIGEFWTENNVFRMKLQKMRKCLTKLSRIVECGAVQKCV